MDFRSPVLIISENQKNKLIDELVEYYGPGFKSPLARDLHVNLSTVKRIFNQRDGVPLLYYFAIKWLLYSRRASNKGR